MIYKPFKTICECGKDEGLIVFGAVRVQCPIWVLHLKMLSKNSDPFFAIDKAILKYIKMQPGCNVAYLSAIIGMDYDFVSWRKDELDNAGMIRYVDSSYGYEVTVDAELKYLSGNRTRPDVEIYADLPVDGVSLEILDQEFYSSRAYYSDRRSSTIVARPIIDENDPKLIQALERLERMSPEEKFDHHLERESHDYSVEGFDLKTIDNIYVVLAYSKEEKKCVRKMFFNNKFIPTIDSLKNSIDYYYLSIYNGVCLSSDGYVPKDGNPFVNLREDQICRVIRERYQIDEVTSDDFLYTPAVNPAYGSPLTIKVTEGLLDRAGEAERLMYDALNRQFVLDVRDNPANPRSKTGFFIVHVDNDIEDKVKRYELIRKYKKEHGKLDLEFLNDTYPDTLTWRRELVKLGLYSDIEEIDIDQYIKYVK